MFDECARAASHPNYARLHTLARMAEQDMYKEKYTKLHQMGTGGLLISGSTVAAQGSSTSQQVLAGYSLIIGSLCRPCEHMHCAHVAEHYHAEVRGISSVHKRTV